MFTGHQLTRLSDNHQGSLRIGGRLDINGYPIHHLVQTKLVLQKTLLKGSKVKPNRLTRKRTPSSFDRTPILKRDLKIALAKKDLSLRDVCRELHCTEQAVYVALRTPSRVTRIATFLRRLIAEATNA